MAHFLNAHCSSVERCGPMGLLFKDRDLLDKIQCSEHRGSHEVDWIGIYRKLNIRVEQLNSVWTLYKSVIHQV